MRKNGKQAHENKLPMPPKDEQKKDPKTVQVPEGEISNETIAARVRVGKAFMSYFSSVDKAACQNFRDPTGTDLYTDYERYIDEDANILDQQPVGVTNQFQINVLALTAATCINDPDFFVRSDSPNAVDLVRREIRRQWAAKNWNRKTRTVFQKYAIGGLGILAYRWDKDKRSVFEPVHTWDLIADPSVTDWNDMGYGGRVIKMSLRKAIERYDPDGKKGWFGDKVETKDDNDHSATRDRLRIDIQLYWDKHTEATLYGGKVIKRTKNRYGEVPLLFLEGAIDPGPTPFPIGYGVLASGLQQQITDLDTSITSTAKNGIPLNLIHETALSKTLQEAWTEGKEQGLIGTKVDPSKAFTRIPAEAVSEATLIARREAHRALHGVMGTNDSMFGQHEEGVTKATESALIAQNSGSRQVQARLEFEQFLDRVAGRVVMMEGEFGGPRMEGGKIRRNSMERELWQAFGSVREIHVINSSTVYRDPTQDQQQTMQLFTTMERAVPLMLQLGMPPPMGLTFLLRLGTDVLRAFGRNNIDEYTPGVQQFLSLIAQTYLPMLVQGQLPPMSDKIQEKPPAVGIQFKDLPPEAGQTLLTRMGLLQPGQQMSPPPEERPSTAGEEGGEGAGAGNGAAHAGVVAQLFGHHTKAEEGERARVADFIKQEQQHKHEAEMLKSKQAHEVGMAAMSAANEPPPGMDGEAAQ